MRFPSFVLFFAVAGQIFDTAPYFFDAALSLPRPDWNRTGRPGQASALKLA